MTFARIVSCQRCHCQGKQPLGGFLGRGDAQQLLTPCRGMTVGSYKRRVHSRSYERRSVKLSSSPLEWCPWANLSEDLMSSFRGLQVLLVHSAQWSGG
ncbi:hypothetical protein SCLCIDRAFT_671857 [Scleroderma citrinum Foug A]|uniref:Uncharacterized protein n=1 Tax=Scleroderma citrinum Foug A TaxID=1036808 RepID=A0A0C3AG36_9AGAM|nr:hypothetical protein SCLCIDRAFT_671857 [Scleroderma citrinum Foug A]